MEALLPIGVIAAITMLAVVFSRVGKRSDATPPAAPEPVRPSKSSGPRPGPDRAEKIPPLEETPLGRRRARPEEMTRTIRGRVHVIDGDTIVINRTKIRLAGIDAPELDQPYGEKSKWAMVDICKGKVVTARLTGETSHDRLVGTCYLPDGTDIGQELVRRGLALDWPLFSGGKYRPFECSDARRKILNGRRWHRSRGLDGPPVG